MVITISSQCFTGHGLVSEFETGTPRDGRKSKIVHHTFYNISALRWTFKLIQTVFNYKKCVLGCKKALFCHCVFPFRGGGGGEGVQNILTRNAHHEREVSNRLLPGKAPGSSRVLDALSNAIHALFWIILIQNGKLKNSILYIFFLGGGGGCCAPVWLRHCSHAIWALYWSILIQSGIKKNPQWIKMYTAKNCGVKITPCTGVSRGPHHAFYTGVKFAVLVQHPVLLY